MSSRETEKDEASVPDNKLFSYRKKLIHLAYLFVATFLLMWFFRYELTFLVRYSLISAFPNYGSQTVLLRVIDAFMVHIKVCLYFTVIIIVPFVTIMFWKVVQQRFSSIQGKTYSYAPIPMIVLFYAGIAFAFFVALPVAFKFLVAYSMESGGYLAGASDPESINFLQISMREHVSLTMKMAIAFGISFESPVVMFFLNLSGLVSTKQFAKNRGLALVVLALFSSVLTPPDPWSMLLLLAPMYALYELGILLTRFVNTDNS